MSVDLAAAAAVLSGLRPFPIAITTVSGGRTNGLISLSAGSGSVVPEAPRVQVTMAKRNMTHDLVKESGVFAMHLLAGGDEVPEVSLEIIMALGGSSGRDGDKLASLATRPGVTGVPILIDALSYVEGRVVHTMETEENTLFSADVVAAERLRRAPRLDIGTAWQQLPTEWTTKYDKGLVVEYDAARRARGLPIPPH